MNLDSLVVRVIEQGLDRRHGRRQRILDAAELVFGLSGYHSTSLAEIASRCEIAVGTLYLYFDDKADLYGSVIVRKLKEVVALLEKALSSQPSATGCLRAAAHTFFAYHDRNRRFFEIFLHQYQLAGSPLHKRHWEETEKLKSFNFKLVRDCVCRGQARGELRDGDPKLFAAAFLGITLQMVRQWIREKSDAPLENFADFAADIYLRGAAALPENSMRALEP